MATTGKAKGGPNTYGSSPTRARFDRGVRQMIGVLAGRATESAANIKITMPMGSTDGFASVEWNEAILG